MRLQVLSDLHLEFAPFVPPTTDADAVVLSGDINLGTKGLAWAKQMWPDRPVIYVAGNHEYYRQVLPALNSQLQEESHGTNVHFLENEELVLDGVRFLGCVLWSDFELFGNGEAMYQAMSESAFLMADYRVIRAHSDGTRLLPADTRRLHFASKQFLLDALARPFSGPTVVVTHHAPSHQSASDQHRHHPTTAAFCSNLDALVAQSGAALWIHGHTHHGVDCRLGNTRLVSNQRGYPNEAINRFDAGLVVEV
jgi:predicted phosphodiesterase